MSFARLVCEKPRNQLVPIIMRGRLTPPTVVLGNSAMLFFPPNQGFNPYYQPCRSYLQDLQEVREPVGKVARIFEKTGFSRLPVFEKDIDGIVGMVTARDLLLEKPRSIRKIIRPVHYTPESRQIAGLLREMQELQINLAVIVDEYGGTAGLVTIEDIVEEFFGEILDEHDEDLELYRNIGLKMIDVNARTGIADLNRRLDLHLPEGEYVTLGGFLIEKLGHIPKTGERVELDECDIFIRSIFRKRIRWVRIVLKGDRLVLPFKKY